MTRSPRHRHPVRAAALALAAALGGACGGETAAPTTGPAGPVHAAHLQGRLSSGYGCSECHAPSGFAVDFSQGSMATLQGRTPTFDPATKTCSNVYCHGDGVASGPTQAVVWNPPSAVACASCHGSPPSLLPGGQAHPAGADCGSCHTGYTATSVNLGLHVNGSIEGTQGCGSCHGLPPASGEHGEHRRYTCGQCHPDGYTSSNAVAPFHDNGTVDLGASAGWNAATRTCANSCHGTERW